MMGKLDIPDRRNPFLPYLVRQKGNGRGGRFRLGRAPRKRRVVPQIKFFREIPQWEPISKHYGPVRQAVEKRMKFAIQSVDLLRIFLCVGPIPLPIRTVQLRQHLPKLPGDGRGVGRGGPNMLIDLRHGP